MLDFRYYQPHPQHHQPLSGHLIHMTVFIYLFLFFGLCDGENKIIHFIKACSFLQHKSKYTCMYSYLYGVIIAA